MPALPGPYETLEIEQPCDGVLLVRLNRPERRNAMSTQMCREIVDVFTSVGTQHRGWRSIVLTGNGDRAFCAGIDLKERKGMSNEAWHEQHQLIERMMLSVLDCPVPVIAAVNGAAYAGGCEFMLLCDFAYASTNARFALTEVTIGIMPGGGGTQTLQRRIGYSRAAEMVFTGKPIDAGKALEWGMINHLSSQDKLMDGVIEVAGTISRNAPLSIRQAKRAMLLGERMDLRTGMFFEVDAYNSLVHTEDRTEGINAFNEKRAPVFKGR